MPPNSFLLKLLAIWLVFFALLPATSGVFNRFELLIVASAGALALVSVAFIVRRWTAYGRRIEDFLAALPSQVDELAYGTPAELRTLSEAVTKTAERIRSIVDQANLEASRRETILACMAEGVLAVDNNLKVVFCNHAFTKVFGTRLPSAEGRPLFEVVREPLLRDVLQRVVRDGESHVDRFQLPSAEGRWFESRALPFGPSQRRSAVIVLHDVTDIHRQEQLRKDFVADVSHELRTPLAAIRGYAETLLDGGLEDSANNHKFVEIIHSHAIRLNNIASDLLVLSSLDSEGMAPVTPTRVDLTEVIESALSSVVVAAEARSISIDASLCERCAVLGVRFRLEQVLVNLLDNAVKFNRDGGEVHIECRRLDGQRKVQLVISDTGIGIPSGDLHRIFDRFYRVDKARSRPAGGTGLGLPIVKEAITRMGGSVNVESQLGRGAQFTIVLDAG